MPEQNVDKPRQDETTDESAASKQQAPKKQATQANAQTSKQVSTHASNATQTIMRSQYVVQPLKKQQQEQRVCEGRNGPAGVRTNAISRNCPRNMNNARCNNASPSHTARRRPMTAPTSGACGCRSRVLTCVLHTDPVRIAQSTNG